MSQRLSLLCDLWLNRNEPNKLCGYPFSLVLTLKASVGIVLGLFGRDPYDYRKEICPIWCGALHVYQTYDGPSASWREIGVSMRWGDWNVYEFENGI